MLRELPWRRPRAGIQLGDCVNGEKRKAERGDGRGGRFLLLPHCLFASEAFRTASPRAIKVLLALCSKHSGFNNGAISLGFRELAALIQSGNNAANSQALCELMERGLVALARSYPKGQRLANEYRLTFINCGDHPATNDYLTWKSGDAGTRAKAQKGNFRAAIIETRTASRVSVASADEETSRFDSLNGGHQNSRLSGSSPVSITSAHIVQPFGDLSEASNVPRRKRPAAISAAPDAEDLRERVLSVLRSAARGSQGQLAALAAIRPAALSKFLNNSGSLNDQARIRLTLALPRTRILEAS
jgi:hypothetical protein